MALNQMQIIQRLQGVETRSFTCSKEFVDDLLRLHFERKISPFLFSEESKENFRVLMEKDDFNKLEEYFSDFQVSPILENKQEEEIYSALNELDD